MGRGGRRRAMGRATDARIVAEVILYALVKSSSVSAKWDGGCAPGSGNNAGPAGSVDRPR